jgi:uncharacterized protein (TIGR02268 family)
VERPGVAACEGVKRMELARVPTASREICVSPGLMTGLRFDVPVTVELQDEVRFEEVVRGRQLLTLVPPADMMPGERLRLTVRFAGDVSQSATFTLVAHPGQATHQVEVYRDARTRESYLLELEQERAKSQWLREQHRDLFKRSQGVLHLVVMRTMGPFGIQALLLNKVPIVLAGTLALRKGATYRSSRSVAAELSLLNASSVTWAIAGASLLSADGKDRKEVMFLQEGALAPNESTTVFIEAEAWPHEAQGEVTLILWDEGSRIAHIKMHFP